MSPYALTPESAAVVDLRKRLMSSDWQVQQAAMSELIKSRDNFAAQMRLAEREAWEASESLRKLDELQAKRKEPRPPMNRAQRRAAARRNG